MNWLFPTTLAPKDLLRSRLMSLAALFVLLFAVVLSLSPAARYHTWAVEYKWMHWGGVVVWLVGFSILYRQVRKLAPDSDPYLLPGAALLVGWGLLTIWRLTPTYGLRQTIWVAVGLAVYWLGIKKPAILNILHRYKYLWLTGMLLLTGLTFLLGTYPGGAGSGPDLWLGCCGVYFQPSEALKLLLIVYLAAYLADRIPMSFGLLQLLTPSLILVGAAIFLLIAQRDLGTASLLIAIYTLTIYLASGKRRILIISALILLAAGIAGYQLFDVIRLRIDAWVNPWLDADGRSYQIVQSIMAFSAGGIFGSGPGLGSPGVVPVTHSDFIYSAIGEETGLLGSAGMLLIIGILALRGLRISLYAPDSYRRLLAGGISIYLTIQSVLIMGGNLRLLPLTGVTLPFVSYGGTSLLIAFISLMILTVISNESEEQPAPLKHSRPYLMVGAVVFVSLFALLLLQGWWALARAPALSSRTDNPRRSISDRYVIRGQLLDRSNQPISVTQGEPGGYYRQTLFPTLGPIVGYNHAIYGRSGLEAGLDDYLLGIRGTPSSTIWITKLLYTQNPPGLDVRLSLDAQLQQASDNQLKDRQGALVLLNASTGEVLAMSSAPGFDPNTLEANWSKWVADEGSPLLNRAAQGLYPIGTGLGPFLLAKGLEKPELPSVPASLYSVSNGRVLTCANPVDAPNDWGGIIQNGCPGASITLSRSLSAEDIRQLYEASGFSTTPDVPLPVSAAVTPGFGFTSIQSAQGEDGLLISPLQMALAVAAFSNQGQRPAPRIAMAVNTPQQGWVVLPAGNSEQVISSLAAQKTARMLSSNVLPIWEFSSSAINAEGIPVSWYLAGTLPDWQGSPLTLALVLENSTALEAQQAGRAVFQTALNPATVKK